MKPKFQIGDIIRSRYDKPSLILEIVNVNGYTHYRGLRQDPDDIKVNGKLVHYSEASLTGFFVVGFKPAAATLFT